LVEIDDTTRQAKQTTYVTPPPHEPGVLPRWLHEQGANVIIAGGMGQRARELFSGNGIQVIVGAVSESPNDLVEAYLNGSLASGQNPCDH
jgi:predicted Fe-Mo cluster-binding NifX family protein